MSPDELLRHFERISEAPGAIARLRRFVYELAVRGALTGANAVRRETRLLGDLASFIMGQAPPGDQCNVRGEGTLFVKVGEFGAKYPERRAWTTSPLKFAKHGDVLICVVGATVGKLNLAVDCAIGRSVAAIRPEAGLHPEFLYLSLLPFTMSLRENARGSAQGVISKPDLAGLLIWCPSMEEQQRVISKVDELLALCDRLEAAQAERERRRDRLAAASLHRLNNPADDPATFQAHARFHFQHLSRLTARVEHVALTRRSLLQLAMRGRLVPQDPADEPASTLLEGIATEKSRMIEQGVLKRQASRSRPRAKDDSVVPTGWAMASLSEMTLKITDGAHKTPTYVDKGVKFVSVKDFSAGRLDLRNTRMIPRDEHEVLYKRCDPRRGDIVLGRIGTLGKAVIIDTDEEFSLFVSVGLIRFSHSFIDPRFLCSLLNSPVADAEFDRIKIGGGTHTNKLNLGDLQAVCLPLPPLAEQRRIVAKVDELMALCDRLETAITTGQEVSRRLLEYVLHRALSHDSEPALERPIQAVRHKSHAGGEAAGRFG